MLAQRKLKIKTEEEIKKESLAIPLTVEQMFMKLMCQMKQQSDEMKREMKQRSDAMKHEMKQ